MSTSVERFVPRRASLARLRELFATLPSAEFVPGRYRATFVGPWWLRLTAGPTVALGGLRGWWGKELRPDGAAVNLVRRGSRLHPRLPMAVREGSSRIDGGPCLILAYPNGPRPWRWIVDELRAAAPGVWLGMTVVDVGWLGRPAFPFVLTRSEGA